MGLLGWYRKNFSDWKYRSEADLDVVAFHYIKDTNVGTDAEAGISYPFQQAFIWDLDKTYIETPLFNPLSLLKDVLRNPTQRPNIPGTKALLFSMQEKWKEKWKIKSASFPLFFITASPPQMEFGIMHKLRKDGIQPTSCFFRDHLRNLSLKKLTQPYKQIGFKLHSLLKLRTFLPHKVEQVCWGDDSESDAIVYNLYSDVCRRRLSTDQIRYFLYLYNVTGEQVDKILSLQKKIPSHDPVKKIYINLAEDTDPEYYLKFGRRTLPVYNTFQTALDLFQDMRIGVESVLQVARDLIDNYGFSQDELELSLDDLIRRCVLGRETVEQILPPLIRENIVLKSYSPSIAPKKIQQREGGQVFELEGSYEPWLLSKVDYLREYNSSLGSNRGWRA